MARRTTEPKNAVARKEQNRINQQAFRERKRKEVEDMRVELARIKAADGKVVEDKSSVVRSVSQEKSTSSSRSKAPLHAYPSGTSSFADAQPRPVPTASEPRDDRTLDPSCLSLFPAGAEPGDIQYQDVPAGQTTNGVVMNTATTTEIIPGFGQAQQYDYRDPNLVPGLQTTQGGDSTRNLDGWHSEDLFHPTVPLPAEALANITSDYIHAQSLALKSAEWFAKAAEVGIKIANTRHQACMNGPTSWSYWTLNPTDLVGDYDPFKTPCMNYLPPQSVTTGLADPCSLLSDQEWQWDIPETLSETGQ
jgi:hypothetical protein